MRTFILFVMVLFVASTGYAIDVSEEWLEEVKELLEEQDAHIQRLTDKVVAQQEEISMLRAQMNTYRRQEGVYLGAAIGYPLFNASGMAMYKFNKWGMYVSPGYKDGFYIQGGVLFKMR